MASRADELLARLPDTFRYSDAVERIGDRSLRTLKSSGHIELVSRGLYRKAAVHADDDLLEIATRSPRATLCLRTALVRHDLIDDIPEAIDVAIPRGTWTPTTRAPVQWHRFDPTTFEIGRELLDVPGTTIGLYCAERSIVDAFRMRHQQGAEMAIEALKAWIRQGGQPSSLLRTAASFPRAISTIRSTLELLL